MSVGDLPMCQLKPRVRCMHTWAHKIKPTPRGCPTVSGPDGRTQTQETIGCQESPWARPVSLSWAAADWSVVASAVFTGHRNSSPSGSSSSFVGQKVNWHHSVAGWTYCWHAKTDGFDSPQGRAGRPWLLFHRKKMSNAIYYLLIYWKWNKSHLDYFRTGITLTCGNHGWSLVTSSPIDFLQCPFEASCTVSCFGLACLAYVNPEWIIFLHFQSSWLNLSKHPPSKCCYWNNIQNPAGAGARPSGALLGFKIEGWLTAGTSIIFLLGKVLEWS